MAVELGSAFISVGLGTNKLGPEIKKLFSGMDADAGSSGSKSGEKFADGFGGPAKAGIGLAAAGIGAALIAGLFSAVSGADAGAKLTAQLGLDPAESERAGGVAGSLYASAYGESLSDVNEAVGSVMSSMDGMRTASAADLEDITAKALNLAGAFEVDVAEATTAAGVLMKSGLAGDADAAMDQITSAMQRVPSAVRGEILPVMTEYSKHFAALGIDGDTAMGMIVAGAENGAIGMDKVGDAVKEFTIRSTDMSAATRTAYETLGLNTEEMTNKLLAGGDSAEGAMGQIVHGLQGIKDPAEQSAAALALFGTPLEDLGTDQIPNFLGLMDPLGDSFDSTAGAADSMGATLNSGPGVALEELKRTVEATFMSFAETALPAITAFTGWLTDNQWVIGTFAALVGVGLVGAFVAWAASVWVATAALLANPMSWLVIGVMALIAGLVMLVANWDAVVAFLTQVWGGFVNWLTSVMDGFLVWWGGVWSGFLGFLSDVWGGLTGVVSGAWNAVVAWVTGAINGFLAWWGGVWSTFSAAVAVGWNGLVTVLQGVWTIISTIISTAWSIIKTIVATALAVLIAIFTGKWDEIGGLFQSAWIKIAGFISTAWDTIWGVISSALNMIGAFIASAWDGIVATAAAFGASITRFLSEAWANVTNGVTSAWNAIIAWIAGVPGRFMAGLAALGNLAAIIGGWVAGAYNAAVGKFNDLVGWVGGLPGRILGALGNLGSLLSNAGRQILDGFLSGLKAGFEGVKDFVGGIGEWIAANKGPKAYDLALLVPAGGWIMEGLEDGIESSLPSLQRTLGGVSATIAAGVSGGSYAGTYTPLSAGGSTAAGGGIVFNGNVGWDPHQVAQEIEVQKRRTQTMAGMGGLVFQ